jgi:hypothetical protein
LASLLALGEAHIPTNILGLVAITTITALISIDGWGVSEMDIITAVGSQSGA